MPRVSIVVPVYNAGKYLRKCLDSIEDQTLKDFEVILVDDGSRDNSVSICEEYVARDSRFRLFTQENSGAGKARENGIAHSHGEFIGFVDSDDWIESNMFESMLKVADEYRVSMVRCNTTMHHGEKAEERWNPPYCNQVLSQDDICQKFIPDLIAPKEEGAFNNRLLRGVVSFIFERKLIVENDIHFPDFVSGEDIVFVVEALLASGGIFVMPQSFYHYMFYNSSSLSKTQSADREKHRACVRERLVQLLKDSSGYEECCRRWEQEDRRLVYLELRIIENNRKLNKREKIKAITDLLNRKETKEAFEYFSSKLPFQMKILYNLIKRKCAIGLYWAVKYKESKELTQKKTRVVFSFDDGRQDSYRAIKLASKYGIKSTLNVTTAYVQGVIEDKYRPCILPAMSVAEVQELYNDTNVEIAGHSHNHLNDFKDIVLGRDALAEILSNDDNLGFASPSSMIDFSKYPLDKFKDNNFLYVRIGPVIDRMKKVYRILRKVSRILGLKYIYSWTYNTTLRETVTEGYLQHGVPVLNDNTLGQLQQVVKRAMRRHYDCILIFHSVLSPNEYMGTDNWSWSIDNYTKLCEWLVAMNKSGKIEFATSKDLIQ